MQKPVKRTPVNSIPAAVVTICDALSDHRALCKAMDSAARDHADTALLSALNHAVADIGKLATMVRPSSAPE